MDPISFVVTGISSAEIAMLAGLAGSIWAISHAKELAELSKVVEQGAKKITQGTLSAGKSLYEKIKKREKDVEVFLQKDLERYYAGKKTPPKMPNKALKAGKYAVASSWVSWLCIAVVKGVKVATLVALKLVSATWPIFLIAVSAVLFVAQLLPTLLAGTGKAVKKITQKKTPSTREKGTWFKKNKSKKLSQK